MKARMKKMISIKSAPILALSLLIVLGTALAVGRDSVFGSGSAVLNPETGLFEGSVDLTITGEEFENIPFTVTLLAPLVPNEEGVLHVEATHTFDFGDGNTFTTNDKGIGEPMETSGLYTLNETLTITSGTGNFEGASGVLHAHGELDLRGLPGATFEIRGVISR
jgi:hypothetical protein